MEGSVVQITQNVGLSKAPRMGGHLEKITLPGKTSLWKTERLRAKDPGNKGK